MERDIDDPLEAAGKLTDPKYGIIKDIELALSIPSEPTLFSAVVHRSHPSELTDGYPLSPDEGGCSLNRKKAVVSGVGEAVERYCACIYRDTELRQDPYNEVSRALNPDKILNFHPAQLGTVGELTDGYCVDKISWIKGQQVTTGEEVWIPAQLAYLNYDRGEEPLIRNPISTGLAAGMDQRDALIAGSLEVLERDAFMIYYLTETQLPTVIPHNPPKNVDKLINRLEKAGLDWMLLDARTDVNVPIIIAILMAEEPPVVSVGAGASDTVASAVSDAIEEAIQYRLYQRSEMGSGTSPINLRNMCPHDILREARIMGWAHESAREHLQFWTESEQSISFKNMSQESNIQDSSKVLDIISDTFEHYIIKLTTDSVASTGFSVARAIIPEAHPLYLRESTPYLDTTRINTVLQSQGIGRQVKDPQELNDYPHPFS